jgi:hypothetical protein
MFEWKWVMHRILSGQGNWSRHACGIALGIAGQWMRFHFLDDQTRIFTIKCE